MGKKEAPNKCDVMMVEFFLVCFTGYFTDGSKQASQSNRFDKFKKFLLTVKKRRILCNKPSDNKRILPADR